MFAHHDARVEGQQLRKAAERIEDLGAVETDQRVCTEDFLGRLVCRGVIELRVIALGGRKAVAARKLHARLQTVTPSWSGGSL